MADLRNILSEVLKIIMRQGLVPQIVGVTGHRDIPDEDKDRLRMSIDQELEKLAAYCPDSPRILISQLAEGADRLVAHRALALGWELCALLPMPQQSYESDFSSEQSISEFRELLTLASLVKTLPIGLGRPECYRMAGEWMSRYAQWAIALWDGQPSEKSGGTADTIKMLIHGIPSSSIELPDTVPVVHIVCRRAGQAHSSEIGGARYIEPRPAGLPSNGEWKRWEATLTLINKFNVDAKFYLDRFPDEIEQNKNSLGMTDLANDNPKAVATSWLYAVADTMSVKAQRLRKTVQIWILVAVAISVLFGQLYSGPYMSPLLLALMIGAIALAVLIFRWGSSEKQLERQYLDYRALAEGCRVQYYWKLAAIEEDAAASFLRAQRDELEWIRCAIQSTEIWGDPHRGGQHDDKRCSSGIRDHWIAGQLGYFVGERDTNNRGSAESNQRLSDKWNRRSSIFLYGGIAMVIVTLVMHMTLTFLGKQPSESVLQFLVVCYGMLFAFSGMSKIYSEIMAFDEHAERYRRSGIGMSIANKKLDECLKTNPEQCKEIFLLVGREALNETSDWLLLHRARPVIVPIGG